MCLDGRRRTVVWFQVSMEDLGSPLLVLSAPAPSAACSSGRMWVVTVVEREEDLHKVVPDGVFWDRSAVSLGLFDDAREVAAAAVFHENVEYPGIAVDVAVVISYNVFVVQVFEDVTRCG